MENVGPMELALLALLALLLFGPSKLPEIGRSLGQGIREFKSSLSGAHELTAAVEQNPNSKEDDDPSLAQL